MPVRFATHTHTHTHTHTSSCGHPHHHHPPPPPHHHPLPCPSSDCIYHHPHPHHHHHHHHHHPVIYYSMMCHAIIMCHATIIAPVIHCCMMCSDGAGGHLSTSGPARCSAREPDGREASLSSAHSLSAECAPPSPSRRGRRTTS